MTLIAQWNGIASESKLRPKCLNPVTEVFTHDINSTIQIIANFLPEYRYSDLYPYLINMKFEDLFLTKQYQL